MIDNSEQFITSFDGQSIYVKTWNPVAKPTVDVVCVNGVGGDVNAWYFLIEAIHRHRQDIRFITYDMRGYGQSSRTFPPEGKTIQEIMAKDLIQVSQLATAKKKIGIGHSFGGVVIQELLQTHPTLFDKVVLVCSATATPNPFSLANQNRWYQRITTLPQLTKLPPSRSADHHLYYKNSFDFSPFRICSDVIVTGGLKRFLVQYASILNWRNPHLETLNNPNVFFLYGLKDVVLWPSKQIKVAQQLPLMNSYSLNTSHNAIVNDPESIADIVVKKVI